MLGTRRLAIRIYLGVPDLRPDYVQAARDLGAPIMVSAAAQAKRWTTKMRDEDQPHPGFRPVPKGRLEGVPAALDSMGFTATWLWGGYAVTAQQYVALAASHRWDFWSSQDLCCEPEIASDEEEIVARLMETGARYDELCRLADEAGISRPMKSHPGLGLVALSDLGRDPRSRTGRWRCRHRVHLQKKGRRMGFLAW